MNVGINADYDYLYDPQQDKVCGYCERCGQDIYTRGNRLCYDCEDTERAREMARIRRELRRKRRVT